MTRNENSDDLWWQTTGKRLEVQIGHSDMWAPDILFTKPVTIHLFIFVEKYRKKTLCLTRKYKPVCRKIIFGFGKKENCDLFIKKNCYLLSDPVVELQQLYEMYCANENIRDNKKMKYFLSRVYMLHVSMRNSWKLIRSSCTWSKSRRLSHCINHWGWAVW